MAASLKGHRDLTLRTVALLRSRDTSLFTIAVAAPLYVRGVSWFVRPSGRIMRIYCCASIGVNIPYVSQKCENV